MPDKVQKAHQTATAALSQRVVTLELVVENLLASRDKERTQILKLVEDQHAHVLKLSREQRDYVDRQDRAERDVCDERWLSDQAARKRLADRVAVLEEPSLWRKFLTWLRDGWEE